MACPARYEIRDWSRRCDRECPSARLSVYPSLWFRPSVGSIYPAMDSHTSNWIGSFIRGLCTFKCGLLTKSTLTGCLGESLQSDLSNDALLKAKSVQ